MPAPLPRRNIDGTDMICLLQVPDSADGKRSLAPAVQLFTQAGTKFKILRKKGELFLWRDIAGYRRGALSRDREREGKKSLAGAPRVYRNRNT